MHSDRLLAAPLALVALLVAACGPAPSPVATSPELRVGITPDAPPMAFRRSGQVEGMEVDLAQRLGAALGRPVRFVELPWRDQIPSLLAGTPT
jgi:ABC-type amino acid transport substrate-binding protein